MKDFAKKAYNAQSQLMQRASLLMIMGLEDSVETYIRESIKVFAFRLGDLVKVYFNTENPFSQDEVDCAICTLDAAIEDKFKAAQHTIEVVKAWRGE